jgi:hypothetical protein
MNARNVLASLVVVGLTALAAAAGPIEPVEYNTEGMTKAYNVDSLTLAVRSSATGPGLVDLKYQLNGSSTWVQLQQFTLSGTDYDDAKELSQRFDSALLPPLAIGTMCSISSRAITRCWGLRQYPQRSCAALRTRCSTSAGIRSRGMIGVRVGVSQRWPEAPCHGFPPRACLLDQPP